MADRWHVAVVPRQSDEIEGWLTVDGRFTNVQWEAAWAPDEFAARRLANDLLNFHNVRLGPDLSTLPARCTCRVTDGVPDCEKAAS